MKRFAAAPRGPIGALLLAAFGGIPGIAFAQEPITDAPSAVEAAKRHVRGRCTPSAPCRFKAERDGTRWRVWVRPARRLSPPGRAPATEGTLVLYFDRQGHLLRRLEAE